MAGHPAISMILQTVAGILEVPVPIPAPTAYNEIIDAITGSRWFECAWALACVGQWLNQEEKIQIKRKCFVCVMLHAPRVVSFFGAHGACA
jgi:hypothetical protein